MKTSKLKPSGTTLSRIARATGSSLQGANKQVKKLNKTNRKVNQLRRKGKELGKSWSM